MAYFQTHFPILKIDLSATRVFPAMKGGWCSAKATDSIDEVTSPTDADGIVGLLEFSISKTFQYVVSYAVFNFSFSFLIA